MHFRPDMRRALVAISCVLVLAAAGGAGILAWADHRSQDRLAAGLRVAGVDVGGLPPAAAVRRLERRVGVPARRPARVRVAGRSFELTAARAGVDVDLHGAVDRADAAGRRGSFLERGWRELTGGQVRHDEPAPVTVDRRAVRHFVSGIAVALGRRPVDARMDIEVDRVRVSPSRHGRRLAARDALARRLASALTVPDAERTLRGRVARIEPKATTADVWDARPVAVTVSRSERRVRVFRRGELANSYQVAVGEPEYPTPTGRYAVQVMQKNPPWNVPDSEWAGELAGQTIPGGDPRNPLVARWIGFNGSVGFHGTASLSSLGRAASHGCVRMRPDDVRDLYDRVDVGAPVVVA
jgi:lipoprotein-anchoring transpeptidase ErfK/SrfK